MPGSDRDNHDIGPAERDDALFVNLILIFQGAAMQQMGKIINPLTGKIEKSIEQARFSIDTLAMLKEKTRGNLSADLERLLESTLLNLRMNFVEESAKEDQAAGKAGAETPEPEAAAAGDAAASSDAGAKPAESGAGERDAGNKGAGSQRSKPRQGKS